MGEHAPPRILLCIEPALLEDVIAGLLGAGVGVVAAHRSPASEVVGSFDLALVTGDVPAGSTARVVIELPASARAGEPSTVNNGASRSVLIQSFADLRAVIVQTVPEVTWSPPADGAPPRA